MRRSEQDVFLHCPKQLSAQELLESCLKAFRLSGRFVIDNPAEWLAVVLDQRICDFTGIVHRLAPMSISEFVSFPPSLL